MPKVRPQVTEKVIANLQALADAARAERDLQRANRASPNGEQAYCGNKQHDWEGVAIDTQRLRVPGGWLYRVIGRGIAFVPLPDVIGYPI